MRVSLAFVIVLCLGSTALAQPSSGAPCADRVATPSFVAPDWVLLVEGLRPPNEVEARSELTRALAAQGSDPSVAQVLALADARRTVYRATAESAVLQEALRGYARVVQQAPDHPEMDRVLYSLAWSLSELDSMDQARLVFHRLIRGYPLSRFLPGAYLSFARHFEGEGDGVAARQFYERVAELNRASLGHLARYRIAWLHSVAREHTQAVRVATALRASLRSSDNDVDVRLRRALARDWCLLAGG